MSNNKSNINQFEHQLNDLIDKLYILRCYAIQKNNTDLNILNNIRYCHDKAIVVRTTWEHSIKENKDVKQS